MIYDAINGMTARARTIGCLLASAVICMSTLCAQVRAATPLNQSERLRRLARLPQVELNSPLTFNPFSGFDLLQDRLSMQREAEALKLILSESPSDAMRYVRLGLICREIGDSGTAKVAFSAAARLFERQGADSSVDGPTLAAYGEAMAGMGKAEAAERILRKSVRAAELEWKTHAALARFLTERVASSAVDGQKTLIGPGSDLAWLANARSSSLQPERLERFQEEIVTAVTALERAIELAPTEAEPRVWRAAAKSVEQYLAGMSGEWQSAGQDPIKRLATLFPPKLAIDMAEAAKLSPTNARVAAMSAVYPILCSLRATNPQAGGTLQLHEAC